MKGTSSLADEELVEIVRTKDQELYREIVVRYQERLRRYANYLLNNQIEADDVVQEAFIKAFINLNGFNTDKKFSSWIYRIVHNEAMNMIVKRKRQISLEENEWVEQILASDETQEEIYDKKEITKMLRLCLDELSFSYREPLTFFYLEERTYEEISDILKIPIGTVGTRINRGKKVLKILFQKKERRRIKT